MSELTTALHEGDALKAQGAARRLIAEQPDPWQCLDLRDYCRVRWTSRFLTEHDFDLPLYDAPLERIETGVTFLFVPGMLNGLLPVEGRFVLMGYSKGMPDITEFLVNYPALAKRVVAVVMPETSAATRNGWLVSAPAPIACTGRQRCVLCT